MLKGKQRKYIAVVVAILVLAAILLFFLLPKQLSFEDGYTQIIAVFEENELNYALSAENVSDVSGRSLSSLEGDLQNFKTSLAGFAQSEDTAALSELADVYVSWTAMVLSWKTLVQANNAFEVTGAESEAEACALAPAIEAAVNAQKELNNRMTTLSGKITAFATAYPEQFEKTNLSIIAGDSASLQQNTDLAENALNELKGLCA